MGCAPSRGCSTPSPPSSSYATSAISAPGSGTARPMPRARWSRARSCAPSSSRATSSPPPSISTTISPAASGWPSASSRCCPTCSRAGSGSSRPARAPRAMAHQPLALLARRGEPPKGPRLLYLDTETTGLAGGTGTYAFLVGVGFFDGDEFEVQQYFMRDLDDEPALLAALEPLLREVDGLVTYNGAGFDLPLLETRFVLARRRWPGTIPHLDLLPAARRLWSARLSDCRLVTVELHALGFERAGDLPGALIPSVYFEYLRRKAPGELPRVFEHNRHDVLSLAALTGWVADALDRAPVAELGPDELSGLGRLWELVDPDRGEACYRMALA